LIILASTSPRRIEIFKGLGIRFTSVSPEFDESTLELNGIDSYYVPVLLAAKKARSISPKYPKDIVIGFDTIVIHNNRILGKPTDLREARRFLSELSGNFHDVVTGCSVIAHSIGIFHTFSDTSKVKFKTLTSDTIENYINKVNTLDKAGAYAIQEYGEMIIDHTEGSIDNIIGLPTEKLIAYLSDNELI
jgi:septum formation protein